MNELLSFRRSATVLKTSLRARNSFGNFARNKRHEKQVDTGLRLAVLMRLLLMYGRRQRFPYMISFGGQLRLCIRRGIQRLSNDMVPPISAIAGNTIMSIILDSMFYNMPEDTSSFFGRGVLLFFTVLLNAFLGAFEVTSLDSNSECTILIENPGRCSMGSKTSGGKALPACVLPSYRRGNCLHAL